MQPLSPGDRILVCGAGPAGLTAAYLLARSGHPVCTLEGDSQVGGLARTVRYKEFRFDIGGHRFFTKIPEVSALWDEMLGEEFLDVPRLSRIHYGGTYFQYPLSAADALRGLGAWQTAWIVLSYLRARLRSRAVEENFEQWVSNRFGRRLYEIFFKTYTEKVWGVPCTEIRAEWAAQRIQGLSLASAILAATSLQKRSSDIRTLIHEFKYPRLGPGQMWERCGELLQAAGGDLRLEHQVTALEVAGGRLRAVRAQTPQGEEQFEADHFISTIPLQSLVRGLGAAVPDAVRAAAEGLAYRDFVLVALILDQPGLFPDNWIYVHTPGVRVGRVQNFGNWSPALVPDATKSCLGMEYFCFQNDDLWTRTDAELISLASEELKSLGLANGARVIDGSVVRMPKAYPIYDATYRGHLDTIRRYLDTIPNLHTIGRNGMHKYNNQDHSMYTAMLAVANLEGAHHDLWAVNTDFEYHEEQRLPSNAQPAVSALPGEARDRAERPDISVIVPVHNAAHFLPATLGALRVSDLPRSRWELIVVDDSSTDRSVEVAAACADRIVGLTGGPRGRAFARNRGAEVARGGILAFVDGDVAVHTDALRRLMAIFAREPEISAVFGAYDLEPADPNLISQYRNLLHRYVHERDAGDASTFWTGCGALRAEVFFDCGGFDETLTTLEDIDLGYRLSACGHRIVLRPEIQGQHMKRWTLGSMIATDVWERGVPWLRMLMQRRPGQAATLNIRMSERICTGVVGTGCVALILGLLSGAGAWLAAGAGLMGVALGINAPLFAWFARHRGWGFAIRTTPLRVLYYMLNGLSVALAVLTFRREREPSGASSRLSRRSASADSVVVDRSNQPPCAVAYQQPIAQPEHSSSQTHPVAWQVSPDQGEVWAHNGASLKHKNDGREEQPQSEQQAQCNAPGSGVHLGDGSELVGGHGVKSG